MAQRKFEEATSVEVKEEEAPPKMEVEEEDPLDVFMQGIEEELKQLRPSNLKKDDREYYSSSEEEAEDLQSAMSNLQANKNKKLLTVTKKGVTYQPFCKNFYEEVPELAKMSMEEVEAWRFEMDGIKVKERGCTKPIRNWAQCGVSKKVLDCLKKQGYEKPTPIQAQAIPCIMSGKDLIGIAKTGSGKTLAFLLPMLRHILDQPCLEAYDGPIGIIMTPTPELAMQITKECKKFTKALGLRTACVYGGITIRGQIAELKRGAEVIVCTPGMMIDMLAPNNGRVINLRRCTYLVLDEADRLFDMGIKPQLMSIIDSTRPDRQTVLLSATFPRQMEALARHILSRPVEVQVGGRSIVCKDVEQNVVVLPESEGEGKFLKLLELLGYYQEQGSALVFVDKPKHADLLLKDLIKASYNCMALHGGNDPFDRDWTISDYKAGKVPVLITTSVAARGLDVKHLILVVNYDCPNHYEDYVHRCGRAGRAGNKGYAYTFLTTEQGRYAGDIIKALELSGNPIPEDLQNLWDDYKMKQVKNKTPAEIQITAEQLLREPKERNLDILPPPPKQEISVPEVLPEYQLRKRQAFKDGIKKNQGSATYWIKYAQWEARHHGVKNAREVYEQALSRIYKDVTLWLHYAEMEMLSGEVDRARKIFDRAVAVQPGAVQLWYRYTYLEQRVGKRANVRQIFERWMEWEPEEGAWLLYIEFEMEQKEIERARQIYERFVTVYPEVENWIRYSQFEETNGFIARARSVFERAISFYEGDEKLVVAFAKFKEKQKQTDGD